MGNPYPAEFVTESGVVVEGGAINFTDPANVPGGGVDFLGWTADASNPANIDSNGGGLSLDGGDLDATGGNVIGDMFGCTGITGAIGQTRYVGGTAAVAPTTGTFLVGDFVISQNGSAWICTVGGTPGTWVALGSVLLAPIASPTFTGVPAGPTAAVDTNTTQLATTAYVIAQAYAKLASPTFTGTVTVPAAAAVNAAPRISQLTSALTITSGALPAFGAWASGTAQQNPVTRQITVAVEVVCDGTANAATCAIAISPDNTTYTTIATPGVSAAVNTVGGSTSLASVTLPAGWWIKLTFSHVTVAASKYY